MTASSPMYRTSTTPPVNRYFHGICNCRCLRNIPMSIDWRPVMPIAEAKKLVGKSCAVYWTNREGQVVRTVSKIYDATFVPMYGGYLVTDIDDLRLDRIQAIEIVAPDGNLTPVYNQADDRLP